MPFSLDPGARPVAEQIVKRSRFVARLRYVKDEGAAKALISEARDEDSGANHHCFAYIIGDEEESRIERSSDDGEPGGTAGAPILRVLQGREMVNIAAVVSRYFGGVKLGAGGLVRAYSGSAAAALDEAVLRPRLRSEVFDLTVDLAEAGRVEAELRGRGVEVADARFGAQANFTVVGADADALRTRIAEITSGRGFLVPVGHVWR